MSTTDDGDAVIEQIEALTPEQREQRVREVNVELTKLSGFRRRTAAQEARYNELVDWSAAHNAVQLDRELDRIRAAAAGGAGFRLVPGAPGADGDDYGGSTPRSGVFGEARRVIDTAARSTQLPDYAAEKATHLVEHGPTRDRTLAARWATTTGDPAYATAFAKLLSDPVRGHLLWTAQEGDAYRRVAEVQTEFRAMSLSPDTAGGALVPLHLDPGIMLTSGGSINPLRRIARVETITTDVWNGVTSAGVTAEWKAEAAEVADASPVLAQPSVPVHAGDAFVPFSFEVGMDAPTFLTELQRLLVDAADQLQATAYTTGSGTGQPRGIITALAGSASEVAAATAETFTAADVYGLQNVLPPRFSARAEWVANIATINRAAQFETTNGARLFPEIGDGRLLRKPLNELSNMDGVINPAATENNRVLLYGDFTAGFLIVDRIGSQFEVIPHVVGANRRPTLQRGALLWFRTGSDVVNTNALRVLNVATTA